VFLSRIIAIISRGRLSWRPLSFHNRGSETNGAVFAKNACSEPDLRNTFGLESAAELEQKLKGEQPTRLPKADPL
jgi:hypothetical protein